VNGQLAIRPCFIGARIELSHARALVEDVLRIGDELARSWGSVNGPDLDR